MTRYYVNPDGTVGVTQPRDPAIREFVDNDFMSPPAPRGELAVVAPPAEPPPWVTDPQPLRRSYAQTPDGAPAPSSTRPGVAFGADGESYESYGYLYSGGPDLNPLLSGRNKFWVFNEMRRSDPAVRSLLWMFKLPIRSAHWEFDPASEDPADLIVADCCAWQFGVDDNEGRLDQSWDQSLMQALLYLDFGCMFEELIWGDVETWRDADGTEQLVRPLNRLAPRAPITIQEIRDDPSTGLITAVLQDVAGAEPIPGDKLAWYVLEKEGRNWFGTSLLRPCYGPWRLKKALMIAAGIAWDRFGAGVPVARYPEGGGVEERRRAEQMAQNIRTHERAWVALEGPPIKDGGKWDLDILTSGSNMPDPVPLLRHYNAEIADAGLQMFTRLGTTETGSRAVGEALGEPFYMATQALANAVALERQKRVVRRFVDVNFGADYDAPRLSVSKIVAKNIQVIAAAIANLAAAGLSFTDPDVQNNIRDALELPHLPDLAATIDTLPDDVGLEIAPSGAQRTDSLTPSPFAGPDSPVGM